MELVLPFRSTSRVRRVTINRDSSKYPQGYFKDKNCRVCLKKFTPMSPSELHCSGDCATISEADNRLMNKYGISLMDYNNMFNKQHGKCIICKADGLEYNEIGTRKSHLVVDHCHETNEVRGLLCNSCNVALGQFKDNETNLLRAVKYLRRDKPKMENKSFRNHNVDSKTTMRFKQMTNDMVINIIVDRIVNGMDIQELCKKYSLTKDRVKRIVNNQTKMANKAWIKFDKIIESSTTIETPDIQD